MGGCRHGWVQAWVAAGMGGCRHGCKMWLGVGVDEYRFGSMQSAVQWISAGVSGCRCGWVFVLVGAGIGAVCLGVCVDGCRYEWMQSEVQVWIGVGVSGCRCGWVLV